MSLRHHPSIRVVVKGESYHSAKSVLDEVAGCDSLRRNNKQTNYEKTERNGDIGEDGYIKLSLDSESGINILCNYSEGEITVEYFADRNEDVEEFKQAITLFENVIYPRVAEVVGESSVRMNITSKVI